MARLTLSSIFVLTSLLSSYTLLTTATPIDAAAHAMITPAPVLQKRAPGMVKLRCDQKAEDQPAACSAFESAIASYLPGSVYAGLESGKLRPRPYLRPS